MGALRSAARAIRQRWWLVGLGIVVLVVVVLAPLASGDPDGLMRVAEDLGIVAPADGAGAGPFAGYTVPWIDDPAVSTIVSGLLGVAIVGGLMVGLGRLLRRRRPD
jgi:hypothetical protein